VSTLNMILVDATLKEVESCGVFAFFGCIESILWNWVTLQRYSPEQQEAETRNRGSSNVIVNIRDLLQQKWSWMQRCARNSICLFFEINI